jgi:transposase
MRRTLLRYSLPLNQGKWRKACEIADAYASEFDRFLVEYGRPSAFARYRSHRQARDELLRTGYKSPFGLQARMWKLALKDAFETVNKYWLSLADALRPLVIAQRERGHFTGPEAHYLFWVLCSSQRIAKLVSGRAPIPSHFSISSQEQRKAVNYLRRVIRRKRGKNPRANRKSSFALDAQMYRVFEQNNRQYISIMTLVPGRRLVIPLTGQGKIRGNVRIVLDEEKRRIEVHQTREVKSKQARGTPQGIDLGVIEVFTDSDGDRWGEGFGRLLSEYSDLICEKGRKRNKLFALARKAEKRGDKKKRERILRYNLGQKKRRKVRRRFRLTLKCKINRSLNRFWKAKAPRVLAHENLSHLRGKFRSRRLSRLVSFWVRGLVKERLIFKASVGGSHRYEANACYSSQECPRCWFVHSFQPKPRVLMKKLVSSLSHETLVEKNRQGDAFQCLFCGYGGDSDAVAATRGHDLVSGCSSLFRIELLGSFGVVTSRWQGTSWVEFFSTEAA